MSNPYQPPKIDPPASPQPPTPSWHAIDRLAFAGLIFVAISYLTIHLWSFIARLRFPLSGEWQTLLEVLQGTLAVILFITIGFIGFRKLIRYLNIGL